MCCALSAYYESVQLVVDEIRLEIIGQRRPGRPHRDYDIVDCGARQLRNQVDGASRTATASDTLLCYVTSPVISRRRTGCFP